MPTPFRRLVSLWLLPAALYLALFVLFTWPLLACFATHFFADAGDGFQNVWNLWWVQTAVVRLGTHPWSTTHLHFPHGTSLLAHTLNPFNGGVAILLEPVLGLVRTYNTLVIGSFVFGALFAFRLALHVTQRYAGSLIAGFAFGFSSFHFAHAIGHLQLVSLEWIPVFLLAWLRMLERPSLLRGAAAALALLLVLLCDYYYFLYCVLAGAIMLFITGRQRRDLRFWLRPPYAAPVATFVVVSALSSGALGGALLALAYRDPLAGAHPPSEFSLDLFGLFVPGGVWRFHALTEPFWSRLPGGALETSVHIGLAATLAIGIAARERARFPELDLAPWWTLLGCFAVLSLGPFLQINGRALPVVLPYRALEILVPPLELSGCPIRMVVMVTLVGGLLAGLGIDALARRGRAGRAAAALLVIGMTVELLPAPLVTTAAVAPGWVSALAPMPKQYGFIDAEGVVPPSVLLYYQTLHGVPMFEGYVSRTPASVAAYTERLRSFARRREFRTLCERFGFAYFLFPAGNGARGMPVAPLHRGEGLELYDVRAAWRCAGAEP